MFSRRSIVRGFSVLFNILTMLTLLVGSVASLTSVHAASTITVTTTADDTADDGFCSLREAIVNANNDALTYDDCAAGSGVDTIVFDDALGTATITLSSALPDITDPYPDGLTINGGGDITLSGADLYRVFWVEYLIQLTLEGLTVSDGHSNFGGAIFNNGTMIINNSIFSSNTVPSADGGAIHNQNGTLVINNSTFSANTVTSISGSGGAIYTYFGDVTITNSTFYGNSSSSDVGGAVYNQNGVLNIYNSTFSGNSAADGGGAIYNHGFLGPATMNLYNTVLANSTGGDCVNYPEFETVTVNGSNNLIEASGGNACGLTNGINGNIVGSDPDLGAVTGSPAYFPLNAGSPAIDAGDDTVCSNPPVNNASQNGYTRPIGAHCDIGSYETPDLTVNVTTDTDDGSCDPLTGTSDCSLREAISAANHTLGDDVITLPAGTYTLTIPGADEYENLTGSLDIKTGNPGEEGGLTINGAGAATTVIQACAGAGCIGIDRVLDIMDDDDQVEISDVTIRNGNEISGLGGGGILNIGQLALSRVILADNSTTAFGGGIANYDGLAVVLESSIIDNTAYAGGGIFGGMSGGITALANSTVSGNVADFGGGVLLAPGGCFTESARVLMADGTYKSIAEVRIGDRVMSYDFNTGQRVPSVVEDTFERPAPGYLRINGLEVTVRHPFAVGNDEWKEARELRVGDRVLGSGWTEIQSIQPVNQMVPVYNLEVAGLHNFYVSDGEHDYLVHNKLRPAANGNPIGMYFSTIANNRADLEGGGVYAVSPASITLVNSIIAGNTLGSGAVNPDCSGTIYSEGYNLVEDTTGCIITDGLNPGTNILGVPALLGPLQDNGGGTPTHALLFGSPAINHVPVSLSYCGGTFIPTDQRGVARPQGTDCDTGAVEAIPDTTAPETDIDSGPSDPDNDSTPTFTFSADDGTGSGIAAFMCQMDSGGYGLCTSPFTSAALPDGPHTFSVYAIDNATNSDATPASYSWTLQVSVPTVTTISYDGPDPSLVGQASEVEVTVSGGSTPSGTVDITGADTNCTITLSAGGGSCNVNFASPGPKTLTATYNGDGAHDPSSDTEPHIVVLVARFRSTAGKDGWILESGENTNAGGTMNSTATTLRMGDDANDRQYRSILSFNTGSLPDTAVIATVMLQTTLQNSVGSPNFTDFGGRSFVDVKMPTFGAAGLELTDFITSPAVTAGSFRTTPIGNLYRAYFKSAAFASINRAGMTQIRIRFKFDDDDDHAADYFSFYSGNAALAANRPLLQILYYTP